MVTNKYRVYSDPDGKFIETIQITGTDDENCQVQLENYLDTKQNCYAFNTLDTEKRVDDWLSQQR